ncbi:MAG: hypothetical protein H6716_18955 [Polyangiaceae bacterium]|nr:hypothetical protein [Polyangiaceae bacterium]
MQHSISRLASSLKFTALAAVFGFVGLASGCSSGTEKCGGVEVDGQCYAKCTDNQCVEGNRCVPDLVSGISGCVPPCGIQDDCAVGTNCVNVNFGEADSGLFCVALLGGKTGQDEACSSNADCDTRRGWKCLGDAEGNNKSCKLECDRPADCAEGQLCTTHFVDSDTQEEINACVTGPCTSNAGCDIRPGYHCIDSECVQAECVEHSNCVGGICKTDGSDADGNTVNYCAAAPSGEKRGPGEYGSSCPGGAADCADGFRCFGRGEGDVYSYCTEFDCSQDSDCGTGFHCGRVRVGDAPCADTCTGIPGDTAAGCVPAADIGAGKKYECGALNLMRNVCIKNEYCAECQTDEDCLGEANQICAKGPDGKKQCTVACDPTVDSCPWGAASECKVFDTDRGIPTCGHKFGACTGSGAGCEPCVDDGDCGPQGICLDSSFTGERYCLDLSFTCDCTGLAKSDISQACKGGGCPKTPGGLDMYCFGFLNDPTSPIDNKCYGANSNTMPFSSPQMGCYPN